MTRGRSSSWVLRAGFGGVSRIPLLIGGAKEWKLSFLLLTGPWIILASTLFLVCNQNSIIRAGEYIREQIEKRLKAENVTGWEEFLEENKHARWEAENVVRITDILVFALYYIGATLLAYETALTIDGLKHYASIVRFVYAAAFLFCAYYILGKKVSRREAETCTYQQDKTFPSMEGKRPAVLLEGCSRQPFFFGSNVL